MAENKWINLTSMYKVSHQLILTLRCNDLIWQWRQKSPNEGSRQVRKEEWWREGGGREKVGIIRHKNSLWLSRYINTERREVKSYVSVSVYLLSLLSASLSTPVLVCLFYYPSDAPVHLLVCLSVVLPFDVEDNIWIRLLFCLNGCTFRVMYNNEVVTAFSFMFNVKQTNISETLFSKNIYFYHWDKSFCKSWFIIDWLLI